MDELRTWFRRRWRWSTTQRAWAERGAALAMMLAAAGGWWVSRGWGWEARLVLAALWVMALAILVRREIIALLGPVFFYEIVRLGRRHVHVTRIIYAGILLVTISYVYAMIAQRRGYIGVAEQATIAGTFFLTFFGVQLGIVGIATPLMVAGAIAEEKERRTLEFLLATDLRGREIVLGKLAARVGSVLLVLLTGLPVLAVLQFFGGIDPGEILALAVVSVVSLYSVACLSVMLSSVTRRGRDAILSTYILLGGYLGLSLLVRTAVPPMFAVWNVTIGGTTVRGGDLIDWFTAGNPIVGANSVLRLLNAGAGFAEVLREVVTDYAVFHLILGTLCLGWAVYRLRAAALGQAGASRARRRRGWRPVVGNYPMRWKELFIEPGPRFHLLVRLLFIVIALLSFWPAVRLISEHWQELALSRYDKDDILFWGRAGRVQLNFWVRMISALIGTLMLLAVALRAAGSVTGEQARQTLDELLTTPLTNDEILNAKWLGALLSPRRTAVWVGAVYFIGLICNSLSPVGLALAVVAWFGYATFFASLGLWCSVRCRTTFQATAATIFLAALALGGHWVVTGLCCYLPILLTEVGRSGDFLSITVPFQAGLTPTAVLWMAGMRTTTEATQLARAGSGRGVMAIFCLAVGPGIYLVFGLLLRIAAEKAFAKKFSQTLNRVPEYLQAPLAAQGKS